MEIAVEAQIQCTDGVCGRSVCVLMNPVLGQVTHLVVRDTASPNAEYIVPVDLVSATIADTIQVNCSKVEMEKMAPFVKTEFIEETTPSPYFFGQYGDMYGMVGGLHYYPYVSSDTTMHVVSVDHLQIPPGELAVRRSTRVEATDGYVGRIDEFVVNPENGLITDLVMREGHLWGPKDVIIPLSAISRSDKDTVFLNLDKHQIESLPTFPVQRRWA